MASGHRLVWGGHSNSDPKSAKSGLILLLVAKHSSRLWLQQDPFPSVDGVVPATLFLIFDLTHAPFPSQVSRNRDQLQAQLVQLCQYQGVLTQTHSLTASEVPHARPTQTPTSSFMFFVY